MAPVDALLSRSDAIILEVQQVLLIKFINIQLLQEMVKSFFVISDIFLAPLQEFRLTRYRSSVDKADKSSSIFL
jgi:hypothetical protein